VSPRESWVSDCGVLPCLNQACALEESNLRAVGPSLGRACPFVRLALCFGGYRTRAVEDC
jgi:hypothetical protein